MSNFITKYKPKSLNEQEFNIDSIQLIQSLIFANDINIILIGDDGSGKSTITDNIIKQYYHDCDDHEIHKNIMHINSLKDQGTIFCRTDLKSFCQLKSTFVHKKKIVRIDNIDCVNEQNQHIFRSLIDKYCGNVNFICCASNTSKIIDQIQSRLLMIQLKLPTLNELNLILQHVLHEEKITIKNDLQESIIKSSKNSISHLLNNLEKIILSEQKITQKNIHTLCDGINSTSFDTYTKYCIEQNYADAIQLITEIYHNGYSIIDILDEYYIYLKNRHLLPDIDTYSIIIHISSYITNFYNYFEHEIELIFFTNKLIQCIHNNNNNTSD